MFPLTRRQFVNRLGRAAAAGVVIGFDPARRVWATAATPRSGGLIDLPRLDGVVLDDEAALAAAADDRGHIVRLRPRAVLRPGSVRDVVAIVRYANEHRLKVAMRGQAHSHYGHTQVEAGIVIDSATLDRVAAPAGDALDAEPGASWGAVADAAIRAGLTPPVMPDVMLLSVGGTLSVGGLGATSQRFGAQADNVLELDVVTGEGRLVTCSPARDRELFELVLAGVGQCGLIVRAGLRLVRAPDTVSLWELRYDDLSAYLQDHERLVQDGRFAHQYGWIERREGGGWQHVIQAGLFDAPAGRALPASGLRFASASEPVRLRYRAYLDRLAAFVASASARPDWTNPRPSVTVFLPAAATPGFIARVLRTPADTAGIWRFDVCPFDTRRLGLPLLRMPAGEIAFSLWLFRTAPAGDAAALQAMLATARSLLDRTREAGGTPYAPYFPGSPEGWRSVLGPALWERLAAAKRRFDPNNVLTPGAGMFV